MRTFFKKPKAGVINILYKSVDICVHYRVSNDSFDHEFGTHILPDYIELEQALIGGQDVTEMLTESQIEDIELRIKKEFCEK